jgi:hypothetical protein
MAGEFQATGRALGPEHRTSANEQPVLVKHRRLRKVKEFAGGALAALTALVVAIRDTHNFRLGSRAALDTTGSATDQCRFRGRLPSAR